MNIVQPFSAPRRLGARGVAAVLAMTLASISQGAQTDISATPLASTTAALVKPNIMLLMDASGSMARTHMPDEVETMMGATSVGYKSSQCNTLYYDPAPDLSAAEDVRRQPVPAAGVRRGPLRRIRQLPRGPRPAGHEPQHGIRRLRRDHARSPVALSRHAPGRLLLRLYRPGDAELRHRPLHAGRHRSDQRDAGRRHCGRR